LAINDYATVTQPFSIINNTASNIDTLLKSLSNTTFSIFRSENEILNSQHGSLAGFVFNKWNSLVDNQLVLLYNDSALLGMPYLINKLSNFYSSINQTQYINASMSAWPKTTSQANLQSFDTSSFTSLIILGSALILPLTSFAVEIVHDKELKCKTQLRLSGCSFMNYWATTFFCYLAQYIMLPVILFTLIYAIPPLNIAAFAPPGNNFSLTLKLSGSNIGKL
jgi:hypothetical protein